MKNNSVIDSFLAEWLPELGSAEVSFMALRKTVQMLHQKCYDDTILYNDIYNPIDPSFSKKSFNYFTLEQQAIEN